MFSSQSFNNKYDTNSADWFIFLILFNISDKEMKKVLKYFEKTFQIDKFSIWNEKSLDSLSLF